MSTAPPVRALAGVGYDPRSRRYRGRGGRYMSRAEVLGRKEGAVA